MVSFSPSELFGIVSSFLSILAVIILLLQKWEAKKTIRISLIVLLITGAVIIILGGLNFDGKIKLFPHLLRIDSPIHFLFGPAAYFYTLSKLKIDFKFRWVHLLHLIPAIINFIHYTPLYFSGAEFKLAYYDGLMSKGTVIVQKQYLLKTISLWSYWIAQVFLFYKYIAQNKVDKKKGKSTTTWFAIFLCVQIICYVIVLLDHLTNLKITDDPYRLSMNLTSLLMFSIVVTLLFFPELLYGNAFTNKPPVEKYRNSKLSEESKEEILTAWQKFIEDSNKPYLNPKLCEREVADLLKTTQQRLSQVINEKTGMNFNDAINALRVNEAKQLLMSDAYGKLTIDAIANKSGFNSKSPFYTAFKKHTGLTPRQHVALQLQEQ